MVIWSAEIKELENIQNSFRGLLPDLEKEFERLIKTDDENIVLLYSRRCLEVIVTDLCECEMKRSRKTEPLKGIIDKLSREELVPSHIITSMHGLNELATYGAHPKDFDPEQVKPALVNLAIIIKWYLRYKEKQSIDGTGKTEERPLYNVPKEKNAYQQRKEVTGKHVKLSDYKYLSGLLTTIILAIILILFFTKISKRKSSESFFSPGDEISLTVLPFKNMTNDTLWDVWQDGIQDNLITFLSNMEEIKVRQKETVNSLLQSRGLINYASITPSISRIISQKLGTGVVIYGSINQAGKTIRVNAQLINPQNDDVIKSFQIESPAMEELIFNVIDTLSLQVGNFLIISNLQKRSPNFNKYVSPTNSPEAYRFFMLGQKAFNQTDYATAIKMYVQAITTDSNFYSAKTMLSAAFRNQGQYDQAKKWCLDVYEKRDQLPIGRNIHISWLHALLFETPREEIKYLHQLLELDDQFSPYYYELGRIYVALDQYDDAINAMTKVFDIYKKWESKPKWVNDYIMLGYAYHESGEYKKEKKLYRRAEKEFPDQVSVPQRQAILSLTQKDTTEANRYIGKFTTILRNRSVTDANIGIGLAYIYTEGGYPDKAEDCYRKSLALEPENTSIMNNLGWFLILHDRNISEGLELLDKALSKKPENFIYLENKGLGLYKQGKYKEALEYVEKSWKLRPGYNHSSYLFLEKVREAAGSGNI